MYESETKAYKLWMNIKQRPLNKKGCEDVTVDSRWHSFHDFQLWFDKNAVPGYDLDKDFLVEGNRVYGPDTCVFIPRWLNSAIKRSNPGALFHGVKKSKLKFMAFVGAKTYLGMFETELDAHQAWQRAKVEALREYQNRYRKEKGFDQRVLDRLECLIEGVERDLTAGLPTVRFRKIEPKI